MLLLGPSGCGKSTLLAALAGLLGDAGDAVGEMTVDGVDPQAARDRVGILFQDPVSQIVMQRSGDDVAFGPENRGVPADQIWPRVRAVLAQVGFPYPLDRPTDALSGGEQQRLALAGVLALEPSLLLLDEPTANLVPPGAALIRQVLASLATRSEATQILVEHRVADTRPLVDRVVVVTATGVYADGTPEQVLVGKRAELAALGVWVPSADDAEPLPRRTPLPGGRPLLSADHVGYRYPGTATEALSGVDVAVYAGEVLAVRGDNGSGKSTLARILGGLVGPSGGRVVAEPAFAGRYAGRPPHRWPAAALAARIGSVFQNPEHQFLTSTVRAELALGPRLAGCPPNEVVAVVDELLAKLALIHLVQADPHTLSGGERRRLSVATAIATRPRTVILDEPTFGQDRANWLHLVDLLGELRDDGCAVVAATHDTDFIAQLADRTLALSGRAENRDPVVSGSP